MIVYRLEKKGIGPFIGRTCYYQVLNPKKAKRQQHVLNQCRYPKNRYNLHYDATRNGDHMFGTVNKELLKAYFGYNLKPYFKQGYRIKAYNVPDDKVLNMGNEVAFPVKYHKLKNVKKVKLQAKRVQNA